jgi:hypothetical protein
MTIVLLAGVILVSLYLAKRLSDANSENEALRTQIASLKKQLVRQRPGARA